MQSYKVSNYYILSLLVSLSRVAVFLLLLVRADKTWQALTNTQRSEYNIMIFDGVSRRGAGLRGI